MLRQSPPIPTCLPPLTPPTRCRGMMPHPPGACCPPAGCCSSLSASPSGWLDDWMNERPSTSEGVSVLNSYTPVSPARQPPTHGELLISQHQHRSLPTSWLCGILATANGVLMESPCRAACWLANRNLSNEDDDNDFTLSLSSPSKVVWVLNWIKAKNPLTQNFTFFRKPIKCYQSFHFDCFSMFIFLKDNVHQLKMSTI